MTRLAVIAFVAQFAFLGAVVRGASVLHEPRALAGAAASIALWSLVWTLRKRRGARIAIAIVAGVIFAAQALFARYWHTPIDVQIIAAARHNWADVHPVLATMTLQIALTTAAAIAIEYALLGARAAVSGRTAQLVALAVFVPSLLLALPLRDATPDLRLVDALRAIGAPAEASAAMSVALPALPSSRAKAPNVLFVLTESVRSGDTCSAYAPSCATSPEVNALLPDRVPLHAMRAVASYTAVSLSAIVTGRSQEGSRPQIASAPTIFEVLRAARIPDRPPTIAYWSAQSESVFERDVRASIDSFITLETLVGHAVEDEDDEVDRGVDRLLATRFEASLPSLAAPYFILLHFSGTHAPYFVNETDAPFAPYTREVAWSKMEPLHNAYRNAIHEQDKSIAASLRAFVAAQGERPWVIVFTSDHGEAFGEHGAIHHGQNLYEEQVHVPGWIAFGNGALTEREEASLRAHARDPVTHLDILPTILDAYGVLRGFPFAAYAAALPGASLFAPFDARAPIAITNCTAMFPCPLNTWGMLDGAYALQAQRWDDDWNCVRDADTRVIEHVTDDPKCDALRVASARVFPRMPNGKPNEEKRH